MRESDDGLFPSQWLDNPGLQRWANDGCRTGLLGIE